MSDNERQEGTVWCPGCERWVPLDDPGTFVEFGPQGARVTLAGTLDLGFPADVFLDYTHMECGAHIRMVSNSTWDEEVGAYVDGANAWIEETVGGEYRAPADNEGAFSGSVQDDPVIWGPTYAALLDAYKAARAALLSRLGEGAT